MKIVIAKPSDAKAVLEIYTPYVLNTAITYDYEVPSEKMYEKKIEKCLEKYPFLLAIIDDRVVGYAYAGEFKDKAAYDWSVESTVYVDASLRGKGVGKKLYEKLETILKLQGIKNVNACIAYGNDEYVSDASVRFHERLGYEVVGKFEKCAYKFSRWYGALWMQKFINEHDLSPLLVKKFSDIRGELDII